MKWKKHKEEFVSFLDGGVFAAFIYALLGIILSLLLGELRKDTDFLTIITLAILSLGLIGLRIFYRWFKHDLSKPETANSPHSVIAFWSFFGIVLGLPVTAVILLLCLLLIF